ncbi:MAG TPA: pyridoxal-dependent decarboxylase [Chloroflexota bacterium]|nr:pyridoxal-dependent decarboxylase [Chloroflexota bacterium]
MSETGERTEHSDPALDAGAGSLALDAERFRRLGYQAVDMATDYLAGIGSGPVFQPMVAEERRTLLEQPLSEAGTAPEALLQTILASILPHPMGNGHPRFFGWVNAPPAPAAIVAELLAATMNPSCAGGDHAAIYLERCTVRWLMELVGFPTEGSMGLLVSGGSMASLTCLAAARQRAVARAGGNVRAEGLQGRQPALVLYMSAEGHSCLRKAAELLGLGAQAVRTIAVDTGFRMDVAALRAAVAADRAAGLQPFCVAASAGTVGSGAIDPLNELADLCAEEQLWLHVDGAYGAVGVLDPAVAPLYVGLDRVDSLAIDPHKWLSAPVECGCALVRDGALLRDTFSLVPPYLRTEEGKGFGGLPWYAEYGFQQSRGFRALKLWMTLQQLGRAGITRLVAGHNALARQLAALVDSAPDLQRAAPVTLSIVCFRYVPETWSPDDDRLDALNTAIMHEVQEGGEAFLSNAVLDGRFVLRACILHYATTEVDVAALVAVVRRTGAAVQRQQR